MIYVSHIINANGNRWFGVLVFQSVHAVELLVNIYSCRFSKKKRARARIKLGGNRWNLVSIQYTVAVLGVRRAGRKNSPMTTTTTYV